MSRLSSSKAYDKLMAPFFPSPNLLLSDPPEHRQLKKVWCERMEALSSSTVLIIQDLVVDHFRKIPSGSTVDLYDSMKRLSWRLLLTVFLSGKTQNAPSDYEDIEIEKLQEQVLHGQFSLFPVSLNARVWRSSRSKGLEARKQLKSIFASRVIRGATSCPFDTSNIDSKEDVASHLLLFVSALAAKALASLLTALLMNLYLFDSISVSNEHRSSYASRIINIQNETRKTEELKRLIRETERLSPPVIGIMRRATQDIILPPPNGQAESPATQIPKGWDVWLYFVGAARDPIIFGKDAESFNPPSTGNQGYDTPKEDGFAFGAGSKSCLGKGLIEKIAVIALETCLDVGRAHVLGKGTPLVSISADKDTIPRGVRAWLGWERDVTAEEWARDMKQLPTQRPSKPIMVKMTYHVADM